MEGFEDLTELEELYISHNGIIELGGLERNVSLCLRLLGRHLSLTFAGDGRTKSAL